MMDFVLKRDCTGVEWDAVRSILKSVGMGHHAPEAHRRAFEASYAKVFVYTDGRLIGFGRAISDGQYQAAVYDCAVLEDFQGKGIGRLIMEEIMGRISHCNTILYASPGKEGFYGKHGFRRLKTGMGRFLHDDGMRERGFTE